MAHAYISGISGESMKFTVALDQLMASGAMSIDDVRMIATAFNAIQIYLPRSLVDAVTRRRRAFCWQVCPTFALSLRRRSENQRAGESAWKETLGKFEGIASEKDVETYLTTTYLSNLVKWDKKPANVKRTETREAPPEAKIAWQQNRDGYYGPHCLARNAKTSNRRQIFSKFTWTVMRPTPTSACRSACCKMC
eukprot:3170372-Prymnesium_polylepis.1